MSQVASLLTDQAHSRSVVMRSVADPPAGGKAVLSACACAAQRTGVGAVIVCEDDPHDAEEHTALTVTNHISAERRKKTLADGSCLLTRLD